MAEGLVPPRIADAAQALLTYGVSPEFHAHLQALIDAPHYVPVADPWVSLSWSYESYRQGSYTANARIPLSVYLAVLADGAGFHWSDVLGKHSELSCRASDFDAELSFDEVSEYDIEHNCSRQWNGAYKNHVSDELKRAVSEKLKELGPFTPETDIHFGDEAEGLLATLEEQDNEEAAKKKQKTEGDE
jgi:hypothetical protein